MRKAVAGLALAAPACAWAFRATRPNFWWRILVNGGGLGAYALAVDPDLRRQRVAARDVASGLASAGLLYGVFQVGDRLARRIMPSSTEEIRNIYALRRLLPRWLIAGLLAAAIAPGEELFWRGLVQATFQRRFGRYRGAAIATACYGGVHLTSGNLTLTGAAGLAGAFWGLQFALQERLPPLIASHIAWDIWIFLVAPTPGGASAED